MNTSLNSSDLEQLRHHGIEGDEAIEQLRRLRSGFPKLDVRRPATVGDGILRLSEAEVLAPTPRILTARASGRVSRFVPASGAASRMFQSLLAVRNRPDPQSLAELRGEAGAGAEAARLFDEMPRFPFAAALAADPRLRSQDLREGLAALLDADGLDYARLPKGLIAFHREGDRSLSALEEQLRESVGYADRIHFTVSPEHREAIEAHVREVSPDPTQSVDYSEQSPATDTLAGDGDGNPMRGDDGRLLLRPGGHGALLRNLDELQADIVYLKNIDNVAPARTQPLSIRWKLLLGELLLQTQSRIFQALRSWDRARPDGETLEELEDFCAQWLGLRLPKADDAGRRDSLRRALERPLRVCGMVRNLGEPGGGPFWVRAADGSESLQIVESSQLDREDPKQVTALAGATHFNPVDLVCGLRDAAGEPFELSRFVDPDTGFLSVKSKDGELLRALERPGLWNGSMADWSTLFVEIPVEIFTPVKTVFDLLRPAHQPA